MSESPRTNFSFGLPVDMHDIRGLLLTDVTIGCAVLGGLCVRVCVYICACACVRAYAYVLMRVCEVKMVSVTGYYRLVRMRLKIDGNRQPNVGRPTLASWKALNDS